MAIDTQRDEDGPLADLAAGPFLVERLSEDEIRIRRLDSAALDVILDLFRRTGGIPLAKGQTAAVLGLGYSGRPRDRARAPGILAGPEPVSDTHIPDSLRPSLERLGVTGAVRQMLETVRHTYPNVEKIELSVLRDEYGDERVRVNVSVPEEGDEETEMYFRCLRRWLDAIPPEAAEKILFTTS